jgi:hypothetical protein
MSSSTRVLFVEDDPAQAQWIVDDVFPEVFGAVDLCYFDSEFNFKNAVDSGQIVEFSPQYAILDVRIHYFSVEDLMELNAPQDFDLATLPQPRLAGVRCATSIRRHCPTAKVVIVTVLDLPPIEGITIIKKHSTPQLIQTLRDVFKLQPSS